MTSPTERATQESAAVDRDAILDDQQRAPTLDQISQALAALQLDPLVSFARRPTPIAPELMLDQPRPARRAFGWHCVELVDGVLTRSGDQD